MILYIQIGNIYFIRHVLIIFMIKNIKHFLVIALIIVMSISSLINVYAITQIGTGSVSWTGSFDSSINWDDLFPGTATGTVSGILINANVQPTLNMTISTWLINLGLLSAWIESTWSLDIEVGTNAINGLSITARSWSWGLTNTNDNSIQINNLIVDSVSESYRFKSAINAVADSTIPGFIQTANLDTEVNDAIIEHTIYTSNKEQSVDGLNDIIFTVSATTDAQTQAGNYEDNITFTVTGNF